MSIHKESASRLVWWGLSVLGLVLIMSVSLFITTGRVKAPVATNKTSPLQVSATQLTSAKSTMLFFGDMYLGRAVNVWAQASPLKYSYPFSGLAGFERDKYDAWLANLECPSVPGVQQSYAVEVEYLSFNCPAGYLPEMSKLFSAVSLANNHTANQGGRKGLAATRSALQAQGMQYFGDYDPGELASTCEVITVGAALSDSSLQTTQGSVPIALCGYHGLGATLSAETLGIVSQHAEHFPVIVYPHMGVEYTAVPTTSQQDTYRAFIDAGASAVLGSHPHWVQPAEVYKGKLIVYSMGNFIFDQPAGETQRGAAIELSLGLAGQGLSDLVQLAKSCEAYQDTCLAQAEASTMAKPTVSMTYAAHGVDMSNHLSKPATGAVLRQILDRLNWQVAQSELTPVP